MFDLRMLFGEQLLHSVAFPCRICFRKLTLVFVINGFLDRADGVEQRTIARFLARGIHQRRLHRDEPLFDESADVAHHSFLSSANGAPDGGIAGAALIVLSVLDVEQVGIDRQLARGEVKGEDLIWQREIVFDRVALRILLICHTHLRPFFVCHYMERMYDHQVKICSPNPIGAFSLKCGVIFAQISPALRGDGECFVGAGVLPLPAPNVSASLGVYGRILAQTASLTVGFIRDSFLALAAHRAVGYD